jgi:putative tryptophan/tyrosine transport system substrate-binding protein
MRRREFITFLGGMAAAWPLVAWAQQPKPVIGYLGSDSADDFKARVSAFRQGLGAAGYVEGRNVTIEFRWADGQTDRLPELAADLVRQQVAVIVAPGIPAAKAAKAATTTIPVIFTMGGDPTKLGLVTSLSQPSGNLTGVSNLATEVGPKRLELLREVAPAATLVALLINTTNPNTTSQITALQAAARTLGLQLEVLDARAEGDFDTVFSALAQRRVGALVIGDDGLFVSHAGPLGALSARHAIPSIFQFREFAAGGGLMSYGSSFADTHRLVASYTARVLKGEKPADLPVQQSAKVEMVINLKTAKALGLNVPLSFLGRADEVIE